jgi:ATP-dependent Clp protease, protease subunit
MIKIDVDPKIKVKKIEEIIDLPVVITVNEFNEKSDKQFREEFSKALNTNQSVIPIIISSFGGQVYSLMSMIAVIEASPIPVATIGVGKIMSCGSILLSCGKTGLRFCDPYATVMIHDASNGQHGKTEEVKASATENERLRNIIMRKMAINCGKESEYFLKLIHDNAHADLYIDAEEAKSHNLVNHIRVPNFKVKLSSEITFE